MTLTIFFGLVITCGAQTKAFIGARLIDGTGKPPVENATLIVRDGKVEAAGKVSVPPGAQRIDVKGKTIMPGLVNAHAHTAYVTATSQTAEDLARQLKLYARYGITTIWSLGGEDAPAFEARDSQNTPALT